MSNYTLTADQLPPKNTLIEWVSSGGQIERGKFQWGVWYPEGSNMYIYYTPVMWRLVDESKEAK